MGTSPYLINNTKDSDNIFTGGEIVLYSYYVLFKT